jgi:sugar diacid utilization regulator
MRTESAERTQRRPSQAQLSLMLGDDLQARESALRKSRRLRLFPPRRMIIAVLEPFADRVGSAGLSRLADQLEHPLRLSDQRAVVIVHEGTLVLLLDARTDVDAALRNFRRVTALPLTIGLSREFDDMRRAAGAHREARRAATIGKRMGAAGKLTRYDQLGLLRLLYQLPEHERHAYVSEVLGSAGEHNPEAADERRVLRALADAHWNVTEAASALFVHRNTLRAKLSKLEDKIGSFFSDSNSRLAVQIALELHRLDEPP